MEGDSHCRAELLTTKGTWLQDTEQQLKQEINQTGEM
jgi:hypothetical protein